MRRILTLCACVAVFSALALAESWTGRLVDSNCYQQQKSVTACNPSTSTSTFALIVSGKAYQLDSAGNTKAAQALQNRADRSTNPNSPSAGAVNAKVTGTMGANDTIDVQTINVQ
jgi:hypothetical protein